MHCMPQLNRHFLSNSLLKTQTIRVNSFKTANASLELNGALGDAPSNLILLQNTGFN